MRSKTKLIITAIVVVTMLLLLYLILRENRKNKEAAERVMHYPEPAAPVEPEAESYYVPPAPAPAPVPAPAPAPVQETDNRRGNVRFGDILEALGRAVVEADRNRFHIPPVEPEPVINEEHDDIPVRNATDNKTPEERFADMQDHNNDPQNVHNSQVTGSLSRKYEELYNLHVKANGTETIMEGMTEDDMQEAKIDATMHEIRAFINKNSDPELRKKAHSALNEIQKGNLITTISNKVDVNGDLIPISEDWILTLVWERIQSPDNDNNREELQTALFDQLVDCTYTIRVGNDLASEFLRILFGLPHMPNLGQNEGDGQGREVTRTVCIVGRVSRILSTFTLLDANPELSKPVMDDKELSNEAYTKANNVLNQALSKYEETHENIRELYAIPDEDLSMKDRLVVGDFIKVAKEKIAIELKRDYENLIDEKTLYTIINNSVSAI
jgi:hypothetical protein